MQPKQCLKSANRPFYLRTPFMIINTTLCGHKSMSTAHTVYAVLAVLAARARAYCTDFLYAHICQKEMEHQREFSNVALELRKDCVLCKKVKERINVRCFRLAFELAHMRAGSIVKVFLSSEDAVSADDKLPPGEYHTVLPNAKLSPSNMYRLSFVGPGGKVVSSFLVVASYV